ncbi:MAG: hypothetical protein B6A08_14415 [Sorangiineae bacterium NIC37A_2]|nr:MAG: hypothetical protein B6A08_14415 [Sorangiineae bacterium NIC37A_2]
MTATRQTEHRAKALTFPRLSLIDMFLRSLDASLSMRYGHRMIARVPRGHANFRLAAARQEQPRAKKWSTADSPSLYPSHDSRLCPGRAGGSKAVTSRSWAPKRA